MSVAVVVPFRGDCPHRVKAWRWVRARYQAAHPDWKIVLSLGPDPWVKAAAVNPAIDSVDADIIVVADADVWCDGIEKAVDAIEDGAPWAIPHEAVRRLTAESTSAYMGGAGWQTLELDRDEYRGIRGGGLVVGRRETFQSVPLDPRFVGWGQEDICWGIALHTIVGEPWRGRSTLMHLWHPPQARMNQRIGSIAGRRLWDRYREAAPDPTRMAQLLEEIHVHQHAHQPQVHAARP